MKKLLASIGITLLASVPALADDQPLTLTYEIFEVSIPHSDLENCPASLNVKDAFCRLVMHADQFHVYVFAEAGDQPLVAFKTFEEEDVNLTLK